MLDQIFKITDIVPVSGTYLCVPCGHTQYFEQGAKFETCEVCLAGTDEGWTGYEHEDAEFWQYLP